MERTKYIPSIIALSAGLVACLVTMTNPYDTWEILLIVLAALIVFYIVGSIVRMILNKILYVTKIEEDTESEEEEGEGSEEEKAEGDKDEADKDSEEKQE